MKRSGTAMIFVTVWAAVLFAAFVIGICIREVRFHSAKVESKANTKLEPDDTDQLVNEPAQRRPMPGPEGMMRERNFSPEERAGFEERRRNMREQLENMSEEEREQFMAQMRERFGGRRQGGGRFQDLSEEERAKLEEERRQRRERLENMTEEERQEYRAQMRERFGRRRPPGNEQGGRLREGDRPDTERQENE